jgi:hypothetical protein
MMQGKRIQWTLPVWSPTLVIRATPPRRFMPGDTSSSTSTRSPTSNFEVGARAAVTVKAVKPPLHSEKA